jgi:predicted DNA-binding protein YlxM (UPF0122 family)
LYARDGYVKWTEVALELGVSRQAVHDRLKRAVASGKVSQADFERYRSASSRATASRRREHERDEAAKRLIQIQLTPENLTWIRTECEIRKVRSSDIINGLITKARNQAAHVGTSPQP